jgi:hypothetical protein
MLLDTQMGYYNALVDYNINLADLEWAVGGFLNEVEK